MHRFIFTTAALATLALAKTDLTGCTSTDVSSPAGASIAWYVPGTGELCDPLDCGGGRAPPKTTVPGCPQYVGTATYSPSYLPGFGAIETRAVATESTLSSSSATGPLAMQTGEPTFFGGETPTGEPTFFAQTTGTDVTYTSASTLSTLTAASSSPSTLLVDTTPMTSPAAIAATQVPVAGGGASNATMTTSSGSGSGSRNGTLTSGTPSQQTGADFSQQEGAAMATARAWIGGVAMAGLGAVVAVL